jgi:Zn-dependent M28 family amino/carboxypeptidase
MISRIFFSLAIGILLFSCALKNSLEHDDGLASFALDSLEQKIKILASDEYQGRRPFTEGEKKTLNYLQAQFRQIGIEPGNGDSFLQEVPMVEITPTADSTMIIKGAKKRFSLKGFDDYVWNTQRTDSSILWQNEEIVFAGFGIVAPEYNWNDYEGVDVKNKIVLVLVNDPGFGGEDTTFFKGNTMTYYGRWTYKYEEAARQGAKGCFVIHNTIPAGYPFAVLQVGWNAPHLYLDSRGKNRSFCEGIGWLSKRATEKIFDAAGLDFNALQSKARKPGFKSFPLDVNASTSMKAKIRYDKSYNVIGKISGREKPEEYIIYSAHWDHLGIGKTDTEGDSIYNGAYDNASGAAGLIEIARAFKNMKSKPKRTVVFLEVTAEEQGLWGSAYYAENPVYAKEKTVANINIDGINPYGKMKNILVIGKGQSELENYLTEEAKLLNRDVDADEHPEKGYYFRSDHFNFAKIGIPALYTHTGNDLVGKGKEHGSQLKDDYTSKYYHQPSDEYDTTRVNFEGGIDDLQLLFQVGKRLSFEGTWPQWKEGSEFKAVREAYKK